MSLVLAVAVPALALGVAATWQGVRSYHQLAEARLRDTAQGLAMAVDRDIAGSVAALEVFALGQGIGGDGAPPDPRVLDTRAHALARLLGTSIFIGESNSVDIVKVPGDFGASLPRSVARAMVSRVFDTGQPDVSGVMTDSPDGELTYLIGVPVRDAGGKVVLVAGAPFDAARLRDVLAAQDLPPNAFAAVTDAGGVVLARSDDPPDIVGRPIPPNQQALMRDRESGTFQGTTRDGQSRIFAFRSIPAAPGWRLVTAAPAALTAAAWGDPLIWLTAAGFVALPLGLWLTLMTARRILHPVHLLRAHARAIGAGVAELGAEMLPTADIAELEDLRQGFAAAEQTLRSNESRMRELLETLDMGAFMTRSLAGKIRFWSKGCERLYGFSAREANGRLSHDLLRTVFPVSLAAMESALKVDGVWEGELRHRTRDGREIVVAARAVARHEAYGELTILETLTDVTRQRAAEDAVREREQELARSEARLRSVFDTAADAILVAAADGRILSANPAAVRMFGYQSVDELVDQDLGVLMQDEDSEKHGGYLAMHRVGGPPRAIGIPGRELQARRRNGSVFPIALSVSSFTVDGKTYLTGMIRDITVAKLAERALVDSETRLRLAIDIGQFGIFDYDMRTGEIHWDERMRAMWGLPPDAPVTIDTILSLLHPDDVVQQEALRAVALNPANGGSYQGEYRVIRRDDGVVRHLAAQGRVFFKDGTPVRILGTVMDVTAQREAEALLTRDKADLERRVEERTAALQQSEVRLAQAAKMEALGRLAGGVAHDFNNVLQAVQGGVMLAQRRMEKDPAAARQLLNVALNATERGAAVTSRLLSFARRGELRAATVEPAALLEGLRQLLEHTLGPSVRLSVGPAAGLRPMVADSGQLEAVLVNLANNARDALPNGYGTIALSAEAVAVAAGRRDGVPAELADGDYIRLSVVDDGVGMAPDVLVRVTEPFFTTKSKGQGTGLGLAMARGFAEQSKGTLSIDSELGHGTRVSLWIPCADPAEAAAAGAPQVLASADPPRPASILLVEDEAAVRSLIAEALADSGHSVTEAKDALAALAHLDSGAAADVLVTDLSMPGGMDGLMLIREVRIRLPGLPALLVTGHAGDAAQEALQATAGSGPFAVLRKPVSAMTLEAEIATLLRAAA